MKEIDILGANRYGSYSKIRIGCRGIVIKNGKLLVAREEVCDYWMLPGGGLEKMKHLQSAVSGKFQRKPAFW